ncbi:MULTISPECIES: hypothetical protein [Bacillus]|nr:MULTISPECIES: hypothetical protein [Bacillus]
MFKINLVKLFETNKKDCCDIQIIEVEESDCCENEQDEKCCSN